MPGKRAPVAVPRPLPVWLPDPDKVDDVVNLVQIVAKMDDCIKASLGMGFCCVCALGHRQHGLERPFR